MEFSLLLGLIIGIGGILLGNLVEGGQLGSLVHGAAAVIVFAGTLGAVIVSSKVQDLKLAYEMVKKAFSKKHKTEDEALLRELLECAKMARKESILSIEPRINGMKHEFLKNVIRSVVDGVDPQIVRTIYERQIDIEEERKHAAAKVWSDAGGYAPTIGIIGAVLGLIQVMGNLSDTSKLGAGIATAFVATIYGVGSANLIFLPLASRLKKIGNQEVKVLEMILEGGICILSGLNPSIIEMKLRSFLEKSK